MILHKSNDLMIFRNERKDCKQLFNDGGIPVCRQNGRICDEDTCPKIKSCTDIGEFIEIVRREANEKDAE